MLIIGFFFTLLSWYWYTKPKLNGTTWNNPPDIRGDNPIIILGTIYGIVAGLAITQALTDYDVKGVPISMTFLLIGFFSIAVTFYHGAAVFLSVAAAELLQKEDRRKLFYNFIFLFAEAILLFFISESLGDIDQFAKMFIALLIVDVVWSIIHQISYTPNDKENPHSSVEWIHLDFLMIGFLIMFMIFHPLHQFDELYINLIFLIALLGRTIVDYIVGWRLVYFRRLNVNNGEKKNIF